jgi:hypothetical protein
VCVYVTCTPQVDRDRVNVIAASQRNQAIARAQEKMLTAEEAAQEPQPRRRAATRRYGRSGCVRGEWGVSPYFERPYMHGASPSPFAQTAGRPIP